MIPSLPRYMIIFTDRTLLEIDEKQYANILKYAPGNKNMQIEIPEGSKNIYPLAKIRNATIMSLEKFYQQYPEKRPVRSEQVQVPMRNVFTSKPALRGLIIGINDFVRKQGSYRSQSLLKDFVTRYQKKYGLDEFITNILSSSEIPNS